MSQLDARSRLVALYAGLVVLGYGVHALPGGLHYRDGGELAFWLTFEVVLFALIAIGSRAAIAVTLALNLLLLATIPFAGTGLAADLAVFLLAVLAQAAVLLLLWRRPRGRLPAGLPTA